MAFVANESRRDLSNSSMMQIIPEFAFVYIATFPIIWPLMIYLTCRLHLPSYETRNEEFTVESPFPAISGQRSDG